MTGALEMADQEPPGEGVRVDRQDPERLGQGRRAGGLFPRGPLPLARAVMRGRRGHRRRREAELRAPVAPLRGDRLAQRVQLLPAEAQVGPQVLEAGGELQAPGLRRGAALRDPLGGVEEPRQLAHLGVEHRDSGPEALEAADRLAVPGRQAPVPEQRLGDLAVVDPEATDLELELVEVAVLAQELDQVRVGLGVHAGQGQPADLGQEAQGKQLGGVSGAEPLGEAAGGHGPGQGAQPVVVVIEAGAHARAVVGEQREAQRDVAHGVGPERPHRVRQRGDGARAGPALGPQGVCHAQDAARERGIALDHPGDLIGRGLLALGEA